MRDDIDGVNDLLGTRAQDRGGGRHFLDLGGDILNASEDLVERLSGTVDDIDTCCHLC